MPRVYLVYHNRIFCDALRAILTTQPGIELVGMTSTSTQIASDVVTLGPDVILLEETEDGPAVEDVRALLTSPTPHRFITLRSDVDGMHVWSQTWWQTVQPQDLLEAIIAGGSDR
jgi:DNA-binding NarL/FixJ family response regulator